MNRFKAFVYSLVMAVTISALVYGPAPVFSAGTGSQIEFLLNQVRSSTGSLAGGHVHFYEAGTTTNKTVYLDINLSSAAANPYTLDSDGTAQLYGDGTYRIVIHNSSEVTVYDRDNVRYEDFATLLITGDMIDNNTLNLNNFPSDLRPIKTVSSLPTCGITPYLTGAVVYLSTDYKLYACASDNTWDSFIDNTSIDNAVQDAIAAGIDAANITGTITSTQIADNSISTPKLQAGAVLAGNIAADNITSSHLATGAVTAGKIDVGAINASNLIADNIITNNMLVGSIAASKLAVDHLSAVNTESGTFQQSYTAPGDDNTTAGAGLKIVGGSIEAYGAAQTFGGTVISSDGNFMVSMGKFLTATGITKRYPLNDGTNFTTDGLLYIYQWTASGWSLRVGFGYSGSSPFGGAGTNIFASSDNASVHPIYTTTTADGGIAARFVATGDNVTAIYAHGDYGGRFTSTPQGGPIQLEPAAGGAPSHTADKGTLWVDSSAILYINTDGSTTWQKVGVQ